MLVSTTTTSRANAATKQRQLIGFNTVEAEQLESLVEFLDKHMNLATGIHHLQNAINVVKSSDESPTRATTALNHVRERSS